MQDQSIPDMYHSMQQGSSGPHLVQHLALPVAQLVEERLVGRALLHGVADLVKVLCAGELVVAVRVQQPKVAVQLAPVVARQLRADRVERDVECPPVGLRRQGAALGMAVLSGGVFDATAQSWYTACACRPALAEGQ